MSRQGPGLVGLLSGLVTFGLLIGVVVGIARLFAPAPPVAMSATSRVTVTVYETRIDGQPVTCTETTDHITGAHSRAC